MFISISCLGLYFFNLTQTVLAFTTPGPVFVPGRSSLRVDAATTEDVTTIDPKEAVKLFGRLAEKYIMLDASGGMCCYSACSGKDYYYWLI